MSTLQAQQPSIEHTAIDGFDALTLAAGELEATFVPGLGMVGASLRQAGEELLHRRDGLRAYRDEGAVMGIPLLHPWANRLAGDEYELHGRRVRLPTGPPLVRCDEHRLPIHGLLAAHPGWSVLELGAGTRIARALARLDFAGDPALRAAFPFPHELLVELTLSARALRVATTVIATGGAPVPIAFGYHPYLRLPGVPREDWHVSLPRRRHLELDARGIPTGRARPRAGARFRLGDRGFDDGYDRIEDGASFSVAGGGREIAVTHHAGYPVAQVYSPPGAPFICFEPMTAPTNALRSGDGLWFAVATAPYRAEFSISVRASTR
jgi:aldose 1-epimerase